MISVTKSQSMYSGDVVINYCSGDDGAGGLVGSRASQQARDADTGRTNVSKATRRRDRVRTMTSVDKDGRLNLSLAASPEMAMSRAYRSWKLLF